VVSKILLGLCAAATATVAIAIVPSAGAVARSHEKIGPNQGFVATVNGQTGVVQPAVIQMACFGPILPGQTGHPLAGQTAEVFRSEAAGANTGLTGPTATYIQAFFGAPPPSPAASAPGNDVFTHYGVPDAVATSLQLPCSGTGNVYFVPLPMTPIGPVRIASVRVAYVGQP
jgi:hypothetical protein